MDVMENDSSQLKQPITDGFHCWACSQHPRLTVVPKGRIVVPVWMNQPRMTLSTRSRGSRRPSSELQRRTLGNSGSRPKSLMQPLFPGARMTPTRMSQLGAICPDPRRIGGRAGTNHCRSLLQAATLVVPVQSDPHSKDVRCTRSILLRPNVLLFAMSGYFCNLPPLDHLYWLERVLLTARPVRLWGRLGIAALFRRKMRPSELVAADVLC
ncbi:hypothetical protein B0O80DRAFT_454934 [Mortierella sp. GBAus27b]|nr:hypothetical protein B0O80DRAFT_454934 [Mortierella sp. GBAus27b]